MLFLSIKSSFSFSYSLKFGSYYKSIKKAGIVIWFDYSSGENSIYFDIYCLGLLEAVAITFFFCFLKWFYSVYYLSIDRLLRVLKAVLLS